MVPSEAPNDEHAAVEPGWDQAGTAAAPADGKFDFARILQLDQYIRISFFAALLPVVLMLGLAGCVAIQMVEIDERKYLYFPAMAIVGMIVIGKGLLLRKAGYRWGVAVLYTAGMFATTVMAALKVDLEMPQRVGCGIGALLCAMGLIAVIAHHLLLKQADRTLMPNRFNEVMGYPLKRGDLLATVAQIQRSAELQAALDFRRGKIADTDAEVGDGR